MIKQHPTISTPGVFVAHLPTQAAAHRFAATIASIPGFDAELEVRRYSEIWVVDTTHEDREDALRWLRRGRDAWEGGER